MALDKALEKDPADRYQSMREMVVDLRRLARQKSGELVPAVAPATTRATKLWGAWPWAVALGLVLAAIVGTIAARRLAPAPALENPLANARFTRLTDFEGAELDASISPDGRFVAFISDRDGPFDLWLSQIGSGVFRNLTQGKDPNLPGPARSTGFSGDGSQVWLAGGPGRRVQVMPLMGGAPRAFLGDRVVNLAWSADGARMAYHTRDLGDPLFVADSDGTNARQIFVGSDASRHNHFPVWSLDGRWIYFVSGNPATRQMDLWRIASAGAAPERLTEHNSEVAYPARIDQRTIIYVAPDQDGAGPWLWAVDVERRITRRVSLGLERYTSVSAGADGRRLVATVANPSTNLWSVPVLDREAQEADASPFPLQSVNARAPRFAGASLYYLSSGNTGSVLRRFRDGDVSEIWSQADAVLLGPPAISPDGKRVALSMRRSGSSRVYVLSADGAEVQPLADTIDAEGAAAWSPDGKWIATSGKISSKSGLFKIPVEGGTPVQLVSGAALDPEWSPVDDLIVYTGANVGSLAPLLAVRPDGTPVSLPAIQLRREGGGSRARFLPDGSGLIYMQGVNPSQDFWMLDWSTRKARQLTRLESKGAMRSFDLTPDGKQIVFDRFRENSDIVLIDLR
jgi:Tol biopolymer transport system component